MASEDKTIKHCLITGGAGFIGSHLAETLLAAGYKVRILDNFSTGKRENLSGFLEQVEIHQGDIRDFDTVQVACEGMDAVLHEAAIASVYESMTDPLGTHQTNVNGTIHVLEAAHRAGVQKVLLASSAAVYGTDASLPKAEVLPVKPASPYGMHKLMAEQYGQLYAELYGLDVICFRYFNVYGPRQDARSQYSGVISIFIDTILEDRTPVVFGDGLQSRDFVSVKDICQANLLALQNPNLLFEILNIGSGKAHNLMELLAIFGAYFNKNLEIQHQPERRGDLRHSLADISKIQNLLGYKPNQNFHTGLQELIAFVQQEKVASEGHLKQSA